MEIINVKALIISILTNLKILLLEEKMNKYKLSYYNYYFNYNDYNIIYNTMSGGLIKLNNQDYYTITDLFKSKTCEKTEVDDIFKDCIDKGLILHEEIEENASVNNLYDKSNNKDELFLIILPTEQCNLRCIYCYEKFKKGKMCIDIQDNIILYVKKNISSYKKLYISWFGGEPLLAIDVIESLSRKLINICNNYNINYRAGITTNGTLLDDNVLNVLLECKVRDFQVTLDGGKSTHDKQRITQNKEGTFSTIYNNLINMKNNKGNFFVILRTNIGISTQSSIKSYVDDLYNDFGDDNRFKLHFVAIADLSGDVTSSIDLCDTYQLFQFYEYATEKGIKFDYYRTLYKPLKMICYAANPNSFVIGSDGIVYKCSVAFEDPLNQVGRIKNNGTMDLDYEKLNLWIHNGFETSEKCSPCKFLPLCYGKFCPLKKISNKEEPCPPFNTHIKKYFELF